MTQIDRGDPFPVTFMVAGVGRSGTTWLHACLEEHPEVFVPAHKELNFFSRYFEKGPDWYREQFAGRSGEPAVGDCSPTYLVVPEAAARIREWLPDVRLVFTVRDPIERAYAAYCSRLSVGKVSRDVDQTLVPGSEYVEDGLYFRHLSRFLELFPSERILVITQDELHAEPAGALAKVFAHVGVRTDFRPSLLGVRMNQRRPNKRFPLLHRALVRTVQAARARSALVSRAVTYARKQGLTGFYHALNRGDPHPVLSREAQQRLADYFRPDVEQLSVLLDRDLSGWLSRYPRGEESNEE